MIVRNNKKVDLRQVGLILTLLAVVGGVSGDCGKGAAGKDTNNTKEGEGEGAAAEEGDEEPKEESE